MRGNDVSTTRDDLDMPRTTDKGPCGACVPIDVVNGLIDDHRHAIRGATPKRGRDDRRDGRAGEGATLAETLDSKVEATVRSQIRLPTIPPTLDWTRPNRRRHGRQPAKRYSLWGKRYWTEATKVRYTRPT